MVEIELSKGKRACIDDEDAAEVSKHKWHCSSSGYAVRSVWHPELRKRTMTLLHRQLMNPKPDEIIDHINGDKLDNRKSNLRICKQTLNQGNRQHQSNNTSGYRGVSWAKGSRKWSVDIHQNYRKYYLGLFEDKEEGAKMYNFWAVDIFGEYATLNDIDGKRCVPIPTKKETIN